MNPGSLKYTKSHEWAVSDGDIVTIGITDFAVKTLTDLVFLELPSVGDFVTAGESFGEVESVKAVSDLLAPVSGQVVETNAAVVDNLDNITSDPFGQGWLIKIKPSNLAELDSLMDRAAYEKQCAEDEH